MRRYITPLLGLAVLTANLASGQDPKPEAPPVKDTKGAPPRDKNVKPSDSDTDSGVHRLVIMNGSNQTVHYFSKNGSQGEQTALRGLERAENEAALADDMQSLRSQYLSTERALEARRRQVQLNLYGVSQSSNSSSSLSTGFPGGYAGYGFGYSGFAGGFGPYYTGTDGFNTQNTYLSSSSNFSRSLANGIGDEGQFKRDMVAQMARQSGPDYANSAAANLDRARNNVVVALNNRPQGKDSNVRGADFSINKPRKAKVTLKDKTVLNGTLLQEDNDWIVLKVDDSEERIRMADVARISLQTPK